MRLPLYLMAGVAAAAFNLSHSHAAMLLTQRPKEGPLAKMHPKRGQGTSPWPACSAPISFANDDLPGRGPQLVTARGRGGEPCLFHGAHKAVRERDR
jgi:hypothetical protein